MTLSHFYNFFITGPSNSFRKPYWYEHWYQGIWWKTSHFDTQKITSFVEIF